VAHILPDGDLFTWCEHGTPLGHRCQFCHPVTSAQPAQTGWKCPGCGHGYAPWVPECHHCPVAGPSAFIAKEYDPGPIAIGPVP
jgi:hypothetical protein